ncbi:MAG: FAD-dependent monooxygenase [Janthinobacterium lividum]
MNYKCDVCVVGNGPIGKAAALGLARAGRSVCLLVPPDAPAAAASVLSLAWDVRVYALNHVARAMLDSLKVWDALDAQRVAPIESMAVSGDGDRHPGSLAFDAYQARVGALAWIVEDSNLNMALDTALKFAPNLNVVRGRAIGLANGTAQAILTLENGDTCTAALVVGADGAQSWVRNQCDIGIDYRPYHQRAVVANFACELPHHGVAQQWFTAHEGIVALLPLPDRRVSLVWSAPDALAGVLQTESLTALAERLSALPGNRLGQLTPLLPEHCKSIPLSLIRAHAITAPRVALVGDAAHVIHPLAGHGMNLGFADVAALLASVTQLATARQGTDGSDCGQPRVLGQYARARKEDILLMQLATDALERLFSSDFEPLRLARNLGMHVLDKLPSLKRQLMAHAMGKAT